MNSPSGALMTERAFPVMLRLRMFILIIMLADGSDSIRPRMPAFTGVCRVTAGRTGCCCHCYCVFMFMLACELGNDFFFFVSAFAAGQRQNAFSFFGGFFCDFSCAEGMSFFVQSNGTTFSAESPVSVRIVFCLSVSCDTVIAITAEMRCPFTAFAADTVCTSKIFSNFGTAVLAQFAVRAGIRAVFAHAALTADRRAVRADFSAFTAEFGTTILTVSAVGTHCTRTIRADAAVGAEKIQTIGAFSAVGASGIGAVHADQTAFVTDFRASAALSAVLAPAVFTGTFAAEIAGGAEFIGAFRTLLTAFRAEIRTFLASVTTDTGDNTLAAFLTVGAERIRTGAVHADAAVKADFIRAVFADFGTFLAHHRTFRATFSAGTDIGRAVNTDSAGSAEIAFSCTVRADTASGTNLVRAVFALFKAFLADDGTVHASGTAETDFYTVFAHTTVRTVITFAAHAIETNAAFRADFIIRTFHAFVKTFRADFGAVHTAVSAAADFHTVLADAAVRTVVAFAADAVKANAAFRTDFVIRTVHAFIGTFGTDFGTFGASFATGTDLIHTVFAFIAADAEVSVTADTLHADPAVPADAAVGAVFALFAAFRADQRTFGAAVPAGANLFHAVFAKSAFGAVVAVTTDTVKTSFTVGAQHVIGTIFALFSAFLTDD